MKVNWFKEWRLVRVTRHAPNMVQRGRRKYIRTTHVYRGWHGPERHVERLIPLHSIMAVLAARWILKLDSFIPERLRQVKAISWAGWQLFRAIAFCVTGEFMLRTSARRPMVQSKTGSKVD